MARYPEHEFNSDYIQKSTLKLEKFLAMSPDAMAIWSMAISACAV